MALALNPIGTNRTEVTIGERRVFFSYKTPVAVQLEDGSFRKTDKKWSMTTTKHINSWLRGFGVEPGMVSTMPQSELDSLTA